MLDFAVNQEQPDPILTLIIVMKQSISSFKIASNSLDPLYFKLFPIISHLEGIIQGVLHKIRIFIEGYTYAHAAADLHRTVEAE